MKKEYLFIVILILLAFVLRFWSFREYADFQGDQGRDALVAKHILIDHNLTLIGPGTSVGKMYLGPLYYYVMVPFLAMTYPDPMGPAYAIALLGVATVVLMYTIGKKFVGKRAAAIAALLFAVAPYIVALSRFSWQPNPAPFVALLMMWFTVQALKGKPWKWFWVAVCFTVLVQLHYVALLSAAPSGILFLYDVWKNKRKAHVFKTYGAIVLSSVLVFMLSQLPLVVFDLRHNGLIRQGFAEFFQSLGSTSPPSERLWHVFTDMQGRGMFLTMEQFGFSRELQRFNTISMLVLFGVVLLQLRPKSLRKNPRSIELIVLALWVGTSVLALSIYRNMIYAHYFLYVLPAVFLLTGNVLAYISRKHILLKGIVYVFVLGLVGWNVWNSPYWTPKTSDLNRIQRIVADLRQHITPEDRYNLTLLNDNRDYQAMNYRYFFEVTGPAPQSEYDYDRLDKLVIIAENGESPLAAPIFEVQQFVNEVKTPELVTTQTYQGIVKSYLYERSKHVR